MRTICVPGHKKKPEQIKKTVYVVLESQLDARKS